MESERVKLSSKRKELGSKIEAAKLAGDYAGEKEALKQLYALVDENREVFLDAHLKLPEVECRLKILDIHIVLRTSGNIDRVIECYKLAAACSTPPSCPEKEEKTCGIIDNRGCPYFNLEKPYSYSDEREHKLCFY